MVSPIVGAVVSGAPVEVATVLCQWAAGGLAYLWITARRREVGLGYGWLLRSVYGAMAVLGAVTGLVFQPNPWRDAACIAMAAAAAVALVRSALPQRSVLSEGPDLLQSAASPEGAALPQSAASPEGAALPQGAALPEGADGLERAAVSPGSGGPEHPVQSPRRTVVGFDPRWDIPAPVLGFAGAVAGALAASGDVAPLLHVARIVVGAAFLGVVTDSMLLGHWYLVQPGLRREPLREMVKHLGVVWSVEVALLLVPTGMVSVLTGTIDDGYTGVLGWFWTACAITTIALAGVALAALRERQYAAVMAATGLLYLAIVTGFGTDLVARLILAG